MRRKFTPFARKARQFRRLGKEVNRLLESGRFQGLAEEKQRSLVSKLRSLYRTLSRIFPARQLRGALAGAALLLGSGFVQQAGAQTFGPPVVSPFNFSIVSDFTFPGFADIDGDGDLDLFSSGTNSSYGGYLTIRFYENVGSAQSPDFVAPVEQPFGLNDILLLNPSFTDIDDDGDFDLFVGQYGGNILFRENTGTPSAPVFGAAQTNPFGLVQLAYFPFTAFADIDNDGDSDLFATEYYGNTKYFENTGSASAPAFAPPVDNPFGIGPPPEPGIRTLAFSDVDLDGDEDLIYHDYNLDMANSAVFYSENTGTAVAPAFAAGIQAPSGVFVNGYYIAQAAFADIDDDGDEDLFFGTYYYYGSLIYFENLATANSLPATANAEVTTGENIPYAFAAADFPFSDADPGDALEGIRILTTPTIGTLTFDGDAVIPIQDIPIADIGLLVFTPNQNEFGDNYSSFDFQVSDGGGYSAFPATMTIDVEENVGTDETVLSVKARLSPNPAVETLGISLSFPQPPGELHFSIADQLGRVCMSWTQDAPGANFTTTAGVADLPAGLYLLRIRSGDRQSVLRFIKN